MKGYSFGERDQGKSYVILIRHGDKGKHDSKTNYSVPGPELSKLGIKQSKFVAKELSYAPVNKIFTSPMRRAIQTSEIIGKKIGISLEILDSFYEFRDLAGKKKLRGKEFSQENKRYAKLINQFNKLLRDNPGRVLVFCTHYRVVQYILANKLKIPLEDSQKILINNCHITMLKFVGKELEGAFLINSKVLDQNK